jgi:hypothetical protein
MGAMHIEHKHELSIADARARVRALGEYLQNRHGIGVTWDASGENARVHGRYMVVEIEGAVAFRDGLVVFEGKDPGFLWRGRAQKYLAEKLAKYLNPAAALETLPRR